MGHQESKNQLIYSIIIQESYITLLVFTVQGGQIREVTVSHLLVVA